MCVKISAMVLSVTLFPAWSILTAFICWLLSAKYTAIFTCFYFYSLSWVLGCGTIENCINSASTVNY